MMLTDNGKALLRVLDERRIQIEREQREREDREVATFASNAFANLKVMANGKAGWRETILILCLENASEGNLNLSSLELRKLQALSGLIGVDLIPALKMTYLSDDDYLGITPEKLHELLLQSYKKEG